MSWNICLVLMKPGSSEISGSKVSSSFFFFLVTSRKKLFTTHKYKCSLKFWLECVMWDTLSFNTVTCGKIESVLCMCVCGTSTCSSGDYFRKKFEKKPLPSEKKVFFQSLQSLRSCGSSCWSEWGGSHP